MTETMDDNADIMDGNATHTEINVEGFGKLPNELVNQSMSVSSGRWNVFGNQIPKEEIVFFLQVILIYIVAITCIVNLTMNVENSTLWTSLLSASLGYMLPAPNLSSKK